MKKNKKNTINITPVSYTIDLAHNTREIPPLLRKFQRKQPLEQEAASDTGGSKLSSEHESSQAWTFAREEQKREQICFSATVGGGGRVRSFVHTRDGVPKLGVSVGRQRIHLHQYLSGGGIEGGQVRINAKVTDHPKTSNSSGNTSA